MLYKKLRIKDLSKDFSESEATLEYYSIEWHQNMPTNDFPRPGMVIVPGGGYSVCSDREGEPIALRFLTEGFNAFVVTYTCNAKYPTPHKELGFFLNYIREHYKEFNLLDENLILCGFSAGGHLAASYASLYPEIASMIKVEPSSIKPLALVLGYPVITMKEATHGGTRDVITGGDESLIEKLSVEDHISDDYPPTYIFTTKTDGAVPYSNSTVLAEQLEKHHVKSLLHLYEFGEHGGSLYTRAVYEIMPQKYLDAIPNRDWVGEASDFLFSLLEN